MSVLAIISTVVSVVCAVCTTVSAVCRVAESVVSLGKSLGIIKSPESQEQIGERCLAADEQGITPEKFNNDYSAYMNAVNNIDMTSIDKSRWTTKAKALRAIEFASDAIIHEIAPSMKVGAERAILAIANHPESDFYTAERMETYIRADGEGRMDIRNCVDYLEGKPCGDVKSVRQQLADVECSMDSSLSKGAALDKIDYVRS